MAFVVTPFNPDRPGNRLRFWQVTALDGDTTSVTDIPADTLHGFQSRPQFSTIFTVDGTDIVTAGGWRIQLTGLPNSPATFRILKNAGGGTGGTVRIGIGFFPGALPN